VALVSPFFAPARGTALHRFLDGDFIPRFLNDAAAGRLSDPAADAWWREDRFSDHDDRLVLRLPVHRTFYVVCCEAVCDRLGQPALDPSRIRSAGFVIRRIGGEAERRRSRREIRRRERGALALAIKERFGGRSAKQVQAEAEGREIAAFERGLSAASYEQAWVLEEGEPFGWQAAGAPARDPDLGRRACLNGVLRRGPLPPAYSGEETHPLHPVAARDANGRRHTLLFGFLPLGGQALARGNPFDAGAETDAVDADRAAHPWPFGLAGRPKADWRESDARQVSGGRPSPAFLVLLETLVNRYRLGEARGQRTDPLNAGLAEAARGLRFVDDSAIPKTVAQPPKEDNELYVRDYGKCVLCYKCVEACGEDAQNTFAIAVAGAPRTVQRIT
jgi:ferredoxin